VKLLDPAYFSWAKDFLASKAWSLLCENVDQIGTIDFEIPVSCPANSKPTCTIRELESDDASMASSVSPFGSPAPELSDNSNTATPEISPLLIAPSASTSKIKNKRKLLVHLVDSDLRRSERVKKIQKGFKGKSCLEKNCFNCSADPPTLTPKAIRSLGASFCNIKADVLSDDALLAKNSPTKVIGPSKVAVKKKVKETKQTTVKDVDKPIRKQKK